MTMLQLQHLDMLMHYQGLSRRSLAAARQSQQGMAYKRLQVGAFCWFRQVKALQTNLACHLI